MHQDEVNVSAPVDWSHPLNRGLVAWWLAWPAPGCFGGNTWRDLTRRKEGILTNGPTWRGTSRPGGLGRLALDGSNDKVVHPALSFAGAFTVAFWAYDTAVNGSIYLGGGGSQNRIGLSSTQVVLRLADNATAINHSETTTVRWRHWVLSRTAAGNVSVYWDGIFLDVRAATGTAVFDTMGCRGDSISFMNGSLDDVRYWDRALSAAAASQVYNLSRRGNPGTLARFGPSRWSEGIASDPFLAAWAARSNTLIGGF